MSPHNAEGLAVAARRTIIPEHGRDLAVRDPARCELTREGESVALAVVEDAAGESIMFGAAVWAELRAHLADGLPGPAYRGHGWTIERPRRLQDSVGEALVRIVASCGVEVLLPLLEWEEAADRVGPPPSPRHLDRPSVRIEGRLSAFGEGGMGQRVEVGVATPTDLPRCHVAIDGRRIDLVRSVRVEMEPHAAPTVTICFVPREVVVEGEAMALHHLTTATPEAVALAEALLADVDEPHAGAFGRSIAWLSRGIADRLTLIRAGKLRQTSRRD